MTPAVEFTTSSGTVYGPWGEAFGDAQTLQVRLKSSSKILVGLIKFIEDHSLNTMIPIIFMKISMLN